MFNSLVLWVDLLPEERHSPEPGPVVERRGHGRSEAAGRGAEQQQVPGRPQPQRHSPQPGGSDGHAGQHEGEHRAQGSAGLYCAVSYVSQLPLCVCVCVCVCALVVSVSAT